MKKYILNKLSFLTIAIILLFNYSCDNDYPTQVSESTFSHTLTIQHFIEDGEEDYADYNSSDQTIVTVALTKTNDSDGSVELPANKTIKFSWEFDEEIESSQQPYLKTFGNQNVYNNGTATTNESGQIWLYWQDQGQTGIVHIKAEYVDEFGTTFNSIDSNQCEDEPVCDEDNSTTDFELISVYGKVHSMEPLDYLITEIEYADDNDDNILTGQIGVRVKDENGTIIEGVTVHKGTYNSDNDAIDSGNVSESNNCSNNCDDAYDISFSNSEAITNSSGKALFDFELVVTQELVSALTNNDETIEIDYNFTIVDENISVEGNTWINTNNELNPATPTLTLTSEAFSIGDLLSDISLEINPEQFVVDDNSGEQTVEISVEALTDGGGILIPPEGETIGFNFSRCQDNDNDTVCDTDGFDCGSLSQSQYESSDGTAMITLTADFNTCGSNVLIESWIDENGSILKTANKNLTLINQEQQLVDSFGVIELELDPILYLIDDIPVSTEQATTSDETGTDDSSENTENTPDNILLTATAKDNTGVGLEGLTINFTNSEPTVGSLAFTNIISNQNGSAENTLSNIIIPDDLTNITITASVIDPTDDNSIATLASASQVATVGYQSDYNISLVEDIDAVFLQNFSLINNINIQYEDSIVAQVLNIDNVPIENVPINFSLTSEYYGPDTDENGTIDADEMIPTNIGYITTNESWSNASGQAGSKFIITPADMDQVIIDQELYDVSDEIKVTINVSVGDNPITNPLTRTYVIEGSANVEEDVEEFHYFPEHLDEINIYTNPGNGTSIQLPFIAKDDEGVRIEGVPVQFEIYDSGDLRSNGSLNTSLATTCCASDSTGVDSLSLFDWDGDGNVTVNENMGIATVLYSNSVPGTFDKIRAFITDPDNQGQNLKEDSIQINTAGVQNQVFAINSYAIPATINIDNIDSVYCDTIYTIAFNDAGESLQNIPINFQLNSNFFDYGALTNSYAETDTVAQLPYFAAKSTFCTWPNIDLGETSEVQIQVTSSVQDTDLTDDVNISIIENLPECPDCEASLSLEAEYYELPAGDNDIFTSLITATVIDSTENPVPAFTLVQFESLTEDENGDLVPIGNIVPYGYTGETDGNPNGIATSTFNMGNDVGLASIVATAPQYNLADTIYLSLYSTSAASLEIVQPFPNEIMVQGGGGVESTEIDVNIKDGNGNLVSEPFIVLFEILTSAPAGVYLNEQDENNFIECVESSNGIATVTLNSGSQPGSVPINVELYDNLELDCSNTSGEEVLATANSIPVTVVTGPAQFGQINYSYIDITPVGGGLYQVPLSVHLWDFYSNPVSDSTNVYLWIEGIAEPWSADSTYQLNDTIKWGGWFEGDGTETDYVTDTYELGVDDPIIIDSLLYVWSIANPLSGFSPGSTPIWTPIAHPGAIDGEAKTGMLAPDNQSYPGVAWSNVYYGTSDIFENTVIKAMTYDAEGNKLVVDSRESHNNEPLVLPFQPGSLSGTTSIQFWDFSVFGDIGLNDLDDTVAVSITANLTDYYQYPVNDGTVLISAPGANVWAVCDPADTDGDGFVGECWEDVNGNGAIDFPPFGTDTINEELGLTCSVCASNGGIWNYDDGDDDDGSIPDGDGIPDDDPIYGVTNGDGQILWTISYSEALNAGDGANPENYADFTSTIILQLLDPLQTASDGVDILLIKSESNDNP